MKCPQADRHKGPRVLTRKRADTNAKALDAYRARQASVELFCSESFGTDGDLPPVRNPRRREECREDLPRFLREYLPQIFTRDFSPAQLRYLADLADEIFHGGQKAVAFPRAGGKTSICIGAIVWAALYGHRRYLVTIAATGEMSKRLLKDILANLGAEQIVADFPEYSIPFLAIAGHTRRGEQQTYRGKLTGVAAKGNCIILPTMHEGREGDGVIIQSAGLTGSIRGLHQIDSSGQWQRPDFVLLDDPQTKESANSVTQTDAREQIILADVMALGGHGGGGSGSWIAAVCACTVISKNDLADRLLSPALHPEWRGQRERLVSGWGDDEKWKEYDATWKSEAAGELPRGSASKFFVEHRAELEKGVEVFDPAMFSEGEVSAVQHARDLFLGIGSKAFAAEYQNDPESGKPLADYTLTARDVLARADGSARGAKGEDAVKVVAAVDVNRYALAWCVCSVSATCELHVMDYGWYTPKGRNQVWEDNESKDAAIGKAVRAVVDGLFASPLYGGEIDALCVDAGFAAQVVHAVMRPMQGDYKRRRIVPAKGFASDRYFMPRERRRIFQAGREADLRYINFGRTPTLELHFDSGYHHYHTQQGWLITKGMDEAVTMFGDRRQHGEFANQATADQLVSTTIAANGRNVPVFQATGRNEMGDCLAMCSAIASLGMQYAVAERPTDGERRKMAAERQQTAAERQQTAAEGADAGKTLAHQQKKRHARRGGSWATGFHPMPVWVMNSMF